MCIRDSRNIDDYRQPGLDCADGLLGQPAHAALARRRRVHHAVALCHSCLLYTSDAADERSSVDLGGRRIIKKKNIVRRI